MSYRFKKQSKTTEPDNESKAYEYAVFLLSLKLRTVGEILKKMKNRGFSEAVIELVIEKLKAQKYLDDEKYVEVFLENLKMYKSFGYYGIKKKFMEKNIPPVLIEAILSKNFTLTDEMKVAKRFLKRLASSTGVILTPPLVGGESLSEEESGINENTYSIFNSETSKVKQKLTSRLKSRGFRGDVIAKLLF
jgi:SOS response regulatory protein OraA/RecX